MAEYLIQGETLTAIADAIRDKTGETGAINPAQFAEKVSAIKVGGGGIGSDFNFEDPQLAYFSYQIDPQNKIITLYKILYNIIYADTGTYDVNIPDKIGGYNVVIYCE